ncbi:hypothetical protein [Streptomyces sp. NBC_01304]|uniref:hypothetical protein n=1 Tax=Streptomyces sp. NBC_01304 TaxID=2903818 RepID=UPI002E14A8A5|nr:hypothetical protein OG430_31905 [Streptomyces sp. NBC_01304]
MGALRRVRRVLFAVGLAGAAAIGVAACEPVGDGLSSVAVAVTTDQTGTKALEREGFDVQWLSCVATMGEGGKTTPKSSGSPSVRSVATVDCQGETKDGRDIDLTGKVTEERGGRCVQGDLTAKVDGKRVFHAHVLGNCSAATSSSGPADPSPDPPPDDPARPTVTVTVTVTAVPPTCDCMPGK